jgi:hypothetical protein
MESFGRYGRLCCALHDIAPLCPVIVMPDGTTDKHEVNFQFNGEMYPYDTYRFRISEPFRVPL